MREYVLEIHGPDGRVVATEPVRVTEHPGRTVLHRLAKRHVLARKASAATLKEGANVHGLFLSRDALPKAAIGTSGHPLETGAWLTAAAQLGAAVRGLIGPDAFVRQCDVTRPWLAPLLMRFTPQATVREHTLGDTRIFEIEHQGSRFFYASRRGRWTLYGAGSVNAEAVDHAVAHGATSAEDLVWALGAIKLS